MEYISSQFSKLSPFQKINSKWFGGGGRACEHLIRIAKLIRRHPIQSDNWVCLSDSNWSFTQFYFVTLLATSPPSAVISFRFYTDDWVLQPSCIKSRWLERKLAPTGPNDRPWLRLLVANPLNRKFPFLVFGLTHWEHSAQYSAPSAFFSSQIFQNGTLLRNFFFLKKGPDLSDVTFSMKEQNRIFLKKNNSQPFGGNSFRVSTLNIHKHEC